MTLKQAWCRWYLARPQSEAEITQDDAFGSGRVGEDDMLKSQVAHELIWLQICYGKYGRLSPDKLKYFLRCSNSCHKGAEDVAHSLQGQQTEA